jgi:DNA-directed RNA polymerase alpha subunit/DNA-directed RNA polymerase subunit L
MLPVVQNISNKGDELKFTLSNVNVSVANSIRRTILSDIPTVVFKTAPYEENKANILVNTSRLNNEIIKQRLSCIPIHVPDIMRFPLKDYLLEVNVENITDSLLFVTTKDFKIKNLRTDSFLSETQTREIFPPNDYTGYFIDFVRLRPRISEEIPGEKLHLTCEFSISNAKDDGMFNVVSTCSYGFTPNDAKINTEIAKKKQVLKDEGKTEQEIKFEIENWKLLDAMRIVIPRSFDFIIQTVGVYENIDILIKAITILEQKLDLLHQLINEDELEIQNSLNTMENCYDIILKNEDYTIGKVIEIMLYDIYFENTLTFCGFKKMHPHDNDSIIRVAYKEPVDKSVIKLHLFECIVKADEIYRNIKNQFDSELKMEFDN